MSDQTELLRLPVWEPAGQDVSFSEIDLLQHLLIVGATGSGKSCLLHRIADQLIGHQANSPQHKTGLLIFDAKVDDTVQRIRRLAVAAGRENDVVVLPDRNHYIDLLSPLRGGLANLDFTVSRLLLSSGSMGQDNAFWDETRYSLLDAALTLLVLGPDPVNFQNGVALMREWLFGANQGSPRVKSAVETMVRRLEELDAAEERKVAQTLDTINLWQNLDPRTRSNVQSTLMLVLRPLLSLPASECFECRGRKAFDVATIIKSGRICIVSLSALNQSAGGLASLFFKVIKADFFRAVHERGDKRGRLVGVIADEYPLLATTSSDPSADDLSALCTIRSRRCFFIAVCQGLGLVDQKLGTRVRKAMIGNFGSVIFMRNREEETDLFAAVHLGVVERISKVAALPPPEPGDLQVVPPPRVKVRSRTLVCPPGTLGRLAPHQGFVALPNHHQHEYPFCFIPWYESSMAPAKQALHDPTSGDYLRRLMASQGFELLNGVITFEAALRLCSQHGNRALLLEESLAFFRGRAVLMPKGLDSLPTAWLKGLPGILGSLRGRNWSHCPYRISELSFAEGALQIRFAREARRQSKSPISSYDRVRIAVNAGLYPSLWRPLTRRHERLIRLSSPGAGSLAVSPLE